MLLTSFEWYDKKKCSKNNEAEFNKSLVLAEKDHEEFKNPTKRWICKKVYEEEKVKVKDHDHITGKYCRSKHQVCNLNLSLIFFKICKTMIHIMSFKMSENIISK